MPERMQMRKSVTGCLSALALVAMLMAAPTQADARNNRALAAGVIGGLSANAILGGYPYYGSDPGFAYGYYPRYPGYPAPVYYVPPLGPPPGCVIRQQKVWSGDGWRWRKLRICH
jgi:hypothetical protein